jgi:hypothetical protein
MTRLLLHICKLGIPIGYKKRNSQSCTLLHHFLYKENCVRTSQYLSIEEMLFTQILVGGKIFCEYCTNPLFNNT